MIRNDCLMGYYHIPASFIKPVSEFLVTPITYNKQFHQNNSIPGHMETC